MPAVVDCPNSLVAFFPASIYRSVGSSDVLPELLRSQNKDKLTTVQFLRNSAVRITFANSADCEAAVSNGITYGDTPLHVSIVQPSSRLVYLRDCPCDVRLGRSTPSPLVNTEASLASTTVIELSGCPSLAPSVSLVSTAVCGTAVSLPSVPSAGRPDTAASPALRRPLSPMSQTWSRRS